MNRRLFFTGLALLLLLSALLAFTSCSIFSGSKQNDSEDETPYEFVTEYNSLLDKTLYVYNGHYYFLFETAEYWEAAQLACEQIGGHLITVADSEEQKFAKELIKKHNLSEKDRGSLHIGAVKTSEGWTWVTGEAFSYSKWAKDEPNGNSIFAGIYNRPSDSRYYNWDDRDASCYYICEWEKKDDIGQAIYTYTTTISTVEELKALAKSSTKAVLIQDIDLSGENWSPIENFSGTLNGNGHTISGLTIKNDTKAIGLFATLTGTVRNLTLSVDIEAKGEDGYVGGVCPELKGYLENVTVTGTINAPYRNYVGGVVGVLQSNGSMKNCTNEAAVHGYTRVGGIVGEWQPKKNQTLEHVENKGAISGENRIGGIIGTVWGQHPGETNTSVESFLKNCQNSGTVHATGDFVGGLVGRQSANYATSHAGAVKYSGRTYLSLFGCENSASINGENCVGGILGSGDYIANVTNCKNTATVTGANYVGGCIGKADFADLNTVENNNAITGKGYVGGIAGRAETISNAVNHGKITSLSPYLEKSSVYAYVGGIAGYAKSINNCTNNTDIAVSHGGSYVGGLVGYLYANANTTHEKNTNNGKVSGASYVGGIAGYLLCNNPGETKSNSKATFTQNSNTKEISGTGDYVGGFFGYQTANYATSHAGAVKYSGRTYLSISDSSNLASISGGNYVGGFVGCGDYITEFSASANSADITGKNYVGGYAGKAPHATFRFLENDNTIRGNGCIGGLSGYGGHFYSCTNNGSVISGASYVEDSEVTANVGGLAGVAQSFNDCINNADIIVSHDGCNVGGLAGQIYAPAGSEHKGNTNNGKVSGADNVGGLAGYVWCQNPGETNTHTRTFFVECSNTKDVSGTGSYVGGLIGYSLGDCYGRSGVYNYSGRSYLSISDCLNSASVSGKNAVGGILGCAVYGEKSDAIWATNSATGSVFAEGLVSGTDVGQLYAIITHSP